MSRHPIDNRESTDARRLKPFTDIARETGEDGTHPAARVALKQSDGKSTGRRTTEFVRIERGRKA